MEKSDLQRPPYENLKMKLKSGRRLTVIDITKLADETAAYITEKPHRWMEYLDTASRIYRYKFCDQLLIHIQRPNAAACATYEQWKSEKVGRPVRTGAKGIALFDLTDSRKLRYVFDITDTVDNGRGPVLWRMQEIQQEPVLEHIKNVYDLEETAEGLNDALLHVAHSCVADISQEEMDELIQAYLGKERVLPENAWEEILQLLGNSIFYMLSRRCGLNPEEFVRAEEFEKIHLFGDSCDQLSLIGTHVQSTCEPILRDIGVTVRNLQMEEDKKRVEKFSIMSYNEFNTLKRENQSGKDDKNGENDLSQTGRLPVPEHHDPGKRSEQDRTEEVRQNAPELAGEEQGVEVHIPAVSGDTARRVRESGPGSRSEDGRTDEGISGEIPGSGDRRSSEMGRTYEQSDPDGGGSDASGTGVYPVNGTDHEMSEAEEEIASALSLPKIPGMEATIRELQKPESYLSSDGEIIPYPVIDEIIRSGGNKTGSQLRIIYNFMIDQDTRDYEEFVCREYRTGGKGLIIHGVKYSVWFDEAGMLIAASDSVRYAADAGIPKVMLTWGEVSGRIHQLLKQGEYAKQSILEEARPNALREHAETLIYMERDLNREVSDLVFGKTDDFRDVFPKASEQISQLLDQTDYLKKLNKRLQVLAEMYQKDKEIMRFPYYRPDRVLVQFEKFSKPAIPYQARADFIWQEPEVFITQDEVDAFLVGGGAYSDGRLNIYAYSLQEKTEQEWTKFIANRYGIGGCSHALAGADDSHADYNAKGLLLTRGTYGKPYAKIHMTWPAVSKRITYLIEHSRYLQPGDYTRMPEYEREQMAVRTVIFFHSLPQEIERPFTDDFFGDAAKKEVLELLSNPEDAGKLADKMETALAALPPDDKEYGQRKQMVSEFRNYLEGNYTIFTEKLRISGQDNHQMTLFDMMGMEERREEKATPSYRKNIGSYVYLYENPECRDRPHLYQIVQVTEQEIYLRDCQNPFVADHVISTLEYDTSLAACPYNAYLRVDANPQIRDSRCVYLECLYHLMEQLQSRILYDGRTDMMTADMIKASADKILAAQENTAPMIYQAYFHWQDFREWICSDLSHLILKGPVRFIDSVTLHERNKNTAEWVHGKQIRFGIETFRDFQETEETMLEESLPDEPLCLTQSQAEAYQRIADTHGDSLIMFELDGVFYSFGEDAKRFSDATGAAIKLADVHEKTVPVSGLRIKKWAYAAERLQEKGIDVCVAYQDGELYDVMEVKASDYIPVGTQITINGRNYQVKSVDFQNNRTVLSDTKWLKEKGYEKHLYRPIHEIRKLYVRDYQSQKTAEPVGGDVGKTAPDQNKPDENQPDEDQEEARENYRLQPDDIVTGGAKTKYKANVEAVNLLHQLEAKGKYATEAEKKVLARYSGWGGIPEAFDENNSSWSKEYSELKETLTDMEYREARASTLSAFYTPQDVIRAIYQVLEHAGLKSGRILEPSCATGSFFGLVPDSLQKCQMYGVELDSISGRIARQLYPKNNILIRGFEQTEYPDGFFDCVIGNVPFGQYSVPDPKYRKHHFLIHDYFIAKSLDLVRPGGIVALVTSSGTMDKSDSQARNYMAERAKLLGAVRLPDQTFHANAGTTVVSDILFFQKKEFPMLETEVPEWVESIQNEYGYPMNRYFISHPEMILGEQVETTSRFGKTMTVRAKEECVLSQQLSEAVGRIQTTVEETVLDEDFPGELIYQNEDIETGVEEQNYSFVQKDGILYFREDGHLVPSNLSETARARVLGMIGLRDTVRTLLRVQMSGGSDREIRELQHRLNQQYDTFTGSYGLINHTANRRAFSEDSSYYLLCSLEKIDTEGNLTGKADIFTKRTIYSAKPADHVDTASEALVLSIGEKAGVDMPYMQQLTGKSEEELSNDLRGVVFLDPESGQYQTADEYLSGNVRDKLAAAKDAAKDRPEMAVNVKYLEDVQPTDLDASEIDVKLGATWIPARYIEQFIAELLECGADFQDGKHVEYVPVSGSWSVRTYYCANRLLVNSAYGTACANAWRLVQDALNGKDTTLYDYVEEPSPTPAEPWRKKKKAILNQKETMLAQQKQNEIRDKFREWIYQDPFRRNELVKLYNEIFNSIRPREYDGSHIRFVGMNPEIELMQHQKNAVAHVLYGNNTLLAHAVGAGKTFEMVAAAMESKRLGLCSKSMIVVPNHLTEQWGADFLRLYPAANILVATKKDFQPANRKKYCSRIATGAYDAVIIGHSQFERIRMSKEFEQKTLQGQIDEIENAVREMNYSRGDSFSVKEMERMKKGLQDRLDRLNNQEIKDDVITFEELGIDRLFVDECHLYKNLFTYTRMGRIAGISNSASQKCTDMLMKCRYMDEVTGGKGITFATGTPVSNSMTELYTNMRYLQQKTLEERGYLSFDAWAADFGEAITSIELAPAGNGYRSKKRFSRFYNLPELISMFRECADIKTADVLGLPVPEAEYINVQLQPSEEQKKMVESFAERAEIIHAGAVDPSVDNMLKVTNDGRKCALDQRLLNDMLPDYEGGKVKACADRIYEIWKEGRAEKTTQIVFCDISTPKEDGSFNVYDDLKLKLTASGIPDREIAFIHQAKTEKQQQELFLKVQNGDIRILVGSTQKLGAGTNVQNRMIALHHLDCPWRPADLEQQEGRILRQGNRNKKVKIYRYITQGTFDAYMFQLIENKQRFIGQIMTSKSPVRSCDDVDEQALSYATVKSLCVANPYIQEKMDLDIKVSRLEILKGGHNSSIYHLQDQIAINLPRKIAALEERITGLEKDLKSADEVLGMEPETCRIRIGNQMYTKMKEAGEALIQTVLEHHVSAFQDHTEVGKVGDFCLNVMYDILNNKYLLEMKGKISYEMNLVKNPVSNIEKMKAALKQIPEKIIACRQELDESFRELETAKTEVAKPFPYEDELQEKRARLNELNVLLNMDKQSEDVYVAEDFGMNQEPEYLASKGKLRSESRI